MIARVVKLQTELTCNWVILPYLLAELNLLYFYLLGVLQNHSECFHSARTAQKSVAEADELVKAVISAILPTLLQCQLPSCCAGTKVYSLIQILREQRACICSSCHAKSRMVNPQRSYHKTSKDCHCATEAQETFFCRLER